MWYVRCGAPETSAKVFRTKRRKKHKRIGTICIVSTAHQCQFVVFCWVYLRQPSQQRARSLMCACVPRACVCCLLLVGAVVDVYTNESWFVDCVTQTTHFVPNVSSLFLWTSRACMCVYARKRVHIRVQRETKNLAKFIFSNWIKQMISGNVTLLFLIFSFARCLWAARPQWLSPIRILSYYCLTRWHIMNLFIYL